MGRPEPLSRRKVVVFDFDGTIADTKAGIIATATTVLSGWGVPETDLARVGEIIGPPFPQAFEQVFGLSHDAAVEVTRRYRDIYTNLGVEAWPAFPGIVELLTDLRAAGRGLAVASSKRANLVHRGLDDNQITDLFDIVCAKGSDDESTKTDAIVRSMRELGADPADTVMVGDRFHDVEGAAQAGIPCIGVTWGGTCERDELVQAGAAVIVDTPDQLVRVLL